MSKERFELSSCLFNENDMDFIIDKKTNEEYVVLDELVPILNQQSKQIADLEAKLAESEFAHNSYFEKAEATISFLQQQFNEKGKIEEQLEELKYQLIEKDEEIKNLVLAHFESDTNKPVLTTTQIINQDKISFCIEQLEKVKEMIKNMSIGIGIEIYGTRINLLKKKSKT